MKDVILVITSSHDRTCDYLISKYREVNFFRFNMDMFSTYKISVSSDGFTINNQYRKVDSNNCKSIYFRKPFQEDLSGIYEEKYHLFSYREAYSVIEGVTESFSGKCLSRPSVMRRTGNKIFQALIASEMGFQMPMLTITNDIENVGRITECESIVKPVSIGSIVNKDQKEYVQTNLFNDQHDLSLLKYTPAYFQHYLKKDYEVRVTFVEDQSFSVRIDSADTVDWRRPGNKVSYSIFSLPDDIYRSCLAFLRKTDMAFGCFDFIVFDGEWYFLEMNANGQWAWLEFETGLKISNAIIDYLDK